MRKFLPLLLIVCLCLTACGGRTAELATHTYEDLSIQIPVDYIDLSGESYAEGLDFVFGLDPIAINGVREEKATFQAYGLELDLEGYAKFLLLANQVNAQTQERDGILTFSYVSGDYTYMVTLHETVEAFWTVQAYCATGDFANAEKDMWKLLSSVTV